ncbi:TetR family transcriptional regulator [Bartonella sp. HY329]|uniref:TetR/AcrR family transcriptional regulator n=1 Tax=unclassified Bartonella TaxID=2645622 RepID=UPI0021C9A64E|nr:MULTISPECIES: TetR/AcrR family transcriptional regulator [unclassified Bartonella]UXM95771.1 TetR family transcriptional regulator [Bartonella sp. HY329]UXN10096.1 TetR family transcriptional regulator [Bartonella sp. HY328]
MARKRDEMINETREKLIKSARHAFSQSGFAAASMDELTKEAGLTRGALYHHFGGKMGLLKAVIAQIEKEIDSDIRSKTQNISDKWHLFSTECEIYLTNMLDHDVQQILMRDGPAVLGDISTWESQGYYIKIMAIALQELINEGTIASCDCEALARLINGALMHAAAWIANAANPNEALEKSLCAFNLLLEGLKTS